MIVFGEVVFAFRLESVCVLDFEYEYNMIITRHIYFGMNDAAFAVIDINMYNAYNMVFQHNIVL